MKKYYLFLLLLLIPFVSYAANNYGYISGAPSSANGSGTTYADITDTGGNVGISSTTPGTTLDVGGIIRGQSIVTDGVGDSYFQLKANASDVATPSSGYGNIYEKTDKSLYFIDDAGTATNISSGVSGWTDSGTTVKLTTSTDNVGIGTATAAQKLHIFSPTTQMKLEGSTQANMVFAKSGTNGFSIYSNAANFLSFYSNDSGGDYLTLNNGNVSIGTSAGQNSLDIYNGDATIKIRSNSTTSGPAISMYDTANALAVSNQYINSASTAAYANSYFLASRQSTIPLRFYQGGVAESNLRELIDANSQVLFPNGNVGIGTTGTLALGGKLVVYTGNTGLGTNNPNATLEVKGTFRTIGTGTSPFTVKSAANQACNTTCNLSQCIVGEDTIGLTFLACSDGTADVCVCMGP